MKKILIFIAVVVVIGVAVAGYFIFNNQKDNTEEMILVTSPVRHAEISSPLSIVGRARGVWFFEASFPIVLTDSYGNVLAETHASAQGEWMTENFVPFLATLQFNNYIKGSKGVLILKKDNPSGLSENDDSIEIPIVFK